MVMLFTTLLFTALTMNRSLADLEAHLQDADPEVRREAAEALCRLGDDAQPSAVALVRVMGDLDEETRNWANAALEELGPPPPSAVPELARLLQSVDVEADVGYWAATLLGRLEAEGATAVEPLMEAARRHFSTATRERAVWALGKIGPAASDAKPLLEQLSTSEQPRLARLAKSALESM